MNIKKTVLLSIIGLTVLAGTVSARANTKSGSSSSSPSVNRSQCYVSQNNNYGNKSQTNRQTSPSYQYYDADCENLVDGEPLALQIQGGDIPAGYILQDDGTLLNEATGESYTLKYFGTGNTQNQSKGKR